MRLIEQLVVLITIVPATQFFRSTLTGLGGGITDSLSSNALSMGAGVAMGAVTGFMSKSHGGNTKVANATSQSSSNLSDLNVKSVKSNNIQSASTNAMRGSIPNANIGTFGKIGQFKNNAITSVGDKVIPVANGLNTLKNSKPAKGVGSIGKVAGGLGKATASLGIAVGGSAVGNKAIEGAGALGFMSATSDLTKNVSSDIGSIKEFAQEQYYNANVGENGFKYVQDLGDVDAYKYDTEKLRESSGIAEMSNANFGNKKGVAVTLDGTMRDENSEFRTENPVLDEQAKDIGNMVRAFKNNDTEAIDIYKSQGIENCTLQDGRVKIAYNNSNSLGVLGVSTDANGKNTIITKTKLANESMNIKIPKLTHGTTYEEGKKIVPDEFKGM